MDQYDLFAKQTNFSADAVKLLQELGLVRKEIDIYDYLLTSGGATPSAIARDTGQPRGRIYESMRVLVAKGFARERPTRPILFYPTPLPEVLAAAQARLSRYLQVVRLEQSSRDSRPAHLSEASRAAPMRMRDVRVLSGRRACYAEILRMVETASAFFWISGNRQFAARVSQMPSLLESIQAAAARGVDIKIIAPEDSVHGGPLDALNAGRAKPLVHRVIKDEAGPIVSCASEMYSFELISQPNDSAPTRGDDVGMQIGDALFANRAKRRLNRVVASRRSVLPWTVPWLGPSHGSDIFNEAVRHSRQEVQVLGPPEWGAYLRANWTRDSPMYDAAVARGVQLRAVVTEEAVSPEEVRRFQRSWEIRLVQRLPMWLTIVDGKELYQAFPHGSLAGAPQFRRSQEEQEVKFYLGIFERLWNESQSTPDVREDTRESPTFNSGNDESGAMHDRLLGTDPVMSRSAWPGIRRFR